MFDKLKQICYTTQNLIMETVDAEITANMTAQRVHVAESWIRNNLSNGPQRAQGNFGAYTGLKEYSATWGVRYSPEV